MSRTFNTLRPRQNGRHFADAIFKCIFLNENVWISIKISLKFVPEGPINNIPALVQIMAWRRPGDKPLSGAMMVNLPTHKCVSRPQWVTCDMGVFYGVLGLENTSITKQQAQVTLHPWPSKSLLLCQTFGTNKCLHGVGVLKFWGYQLISPWPKWPPFRRRYFNMQFHEWKIL